MYKNYGLLSYDNPFSVLDENGGKLDKVYTFSKQAASGLYRVLWHAGMVGFVISVILVGIFIMRVKNGKMEAENKMKFEIVIGCIIVFSMAITLISWANDWGKQL